MADKNLFYGVYFTLLLTLYLFLGGIFAFASSIFDLIPLPNLENYVLMFAILKISAI